MIPEEALLPWTQGRKIVQDSPNVLLSLLLSSCGKCCCCLLHCLEHVHVFVMIIPFVQTISVLLLKVALCSIQACSLFVYFFYFCSQGSVYTVYKTKLSVFGVSGH